jgi:hypothetical protein
MLSPTGPFVADLRYRVKVLHTYKGQRSNSCGMYLFCLPIKSQRFHDLESMHAACDSRDRQVETWLGDISNLPSLLCAPPRSWSCGKKVSAQEPFFSQEQRDMSMRMAALLSFVSQLP